MLACISVGSMVVVILAPVIFLVVSIRFVKYLRSVDLISKSKNK